MDGVWTFVIPSGNGGGVVFARNGKVYGGDLGYFFDGTFTIHGSAVNVTMDVALFNPHAVLASVWGDAAPQFKVSFNGQRSGDIITGQIQRSDLPATLDVTLTRRADVP